MQMVQATKSEIDMEIDMEKHFFTGFYLIRNRGTKDVLGILNVREVVGTHTVITLNKIVNIIGWNLNLGPAERWNMEHISQAEYETYRDLHGFRVFT